MKTRIFVDAHVFDDGYQGTRTYIKGIYSELAEKEDLHLFMGAYDINNLKNHFPSGHNITWVPYRKRSSVYRLLFDIPGIIKTHKIDFAHFQYIVPIRKNCRFIVTTHDVIFNEFPSEFSVAYRRRKNLLYRISAQRADILTTVSEFSFQSIRKHLGIKNKPVHVIPNGVDDDFFRTMGKNESIERIRTEFGAENFILYVSRVEPRKNHMLILQSYLDLQLYSKGIHLVFIGSRTMPVPELDELMQKVQRGTTKYIHLIDRVDESTLRDFYNAARLFIYPSRAEGFGIPPLEAGAMKIPVLCSSSSAMQDYSFFGHSLFDPADEAGFRSKLTWMIDNPPAEEELERIKLLIREKYSWKQSAEKLYRTIVDEKIKLQKEKM